ncbi:thioesterase domain-containing protein [Kribbella sp. NPDC050820]|uniref:thioesterase II family protein n=1 Tax=Kribbella sp. NPDC050820 TaxID=3155408 RepID=UPI0033E1FB47
MPASFTSSPVHPAYLVMFPHAGASGSYFRDWADLLPVDAGMVAATYPGRSYRVDEPLREDIEVLARELAVELDQLGGRQVYFGHSLGALVAYRVALVAARPPEAIVVSACGIPQAPHLRRGGRLGDREIWTEVVALGGTPPILVSSGEFRELAVPVLRSDYRLAASAGPGSRLLEMPLVACAGDADPTVSVADMAGWIGLTAAAFELRVFEGDHFYLETARSDLVDLCLGLLRRSAP